MSLSAIPIMGLFVSLVSVFIGLGGGIILVPLLPSVFGLGVHESVATSLFTIFFVVSENSYRFHKKKQGLIHWPVVLLMGPVSALTAMISAQISQKTSPERILDVLGVILALIALKNLFPSLLSKNHGSPLTFISKKFSPTDTKPPGTKSHEKHGLGAREKFFSMGGGVLAGLTSGFAGVGSGVVLSPVMILLKTVKPVQLVPTANANMVFTTLGGCLSFLAGSQSVDWNQWGLIRWDIALGLFVSVSLFSHFFRPHQNKLPLKTKSIILSLILGGLIFKIFYIGVH